ncbi:MAG: UMP kinase [Christensenellales bacterium]
MVKYDRVIIKISGEALAGEQGYGIDSDILHRVADDIIDVTKQGVEVALVVGGGNIWRGRNSMGIERSTADYMGMLATVVNALALQDALEKKGVDTRVQTAIAMSQIAEPYIRRRADRHLEKKRIVIFACGTGNPYFSTDSAAALRAAEMNAKAILLAKKVDGVYDSDPEINPKAKKFDKISYIDVINKQLAVMDTTAITLCMENNIPILVFKVTQKDAMLKAIEGKNVGTVIC